MPSASIITAGLGTKIVLEAVTKSGFTTVALGNAMIRQSNTQPERILLFDLTLDGLTYQFQLEFLDETLHARDILGHLKRREQVLGQDDLSHRQ